MRKLKCLRASGLTIEELLDELNERLKEFGINESDIVTINALPLTLGTKSSTPTGTKDAKVELTIFYWAEQ